MNTALRDIMIAIGAQSVKSSPAATQTERVFFARAQRSAFDDMLENPSLELVRVFLLMSFYMLGACRRNAAFMYIGIAARVAAALGLHQNDSSGSIPASEKHQRYGHKSATSSILMCPQSPYMDEPLYVRPAG